MSIVKIRLILAWCIGIAISVLLSVGFGRLSAELGLHTYVEYGDVIALDRGDFTNDGDGYSTILGTWITLVSITIGARIGMAFFTKKWSGGSDRKDILFLSLLMIGISVYTALYTFSWSFIANEMLEYEYVRYGVEIAVVGGLYWGLRWIYWDRIYEWEK